MARIIIPDAVLNPQDPSYNATLGGLAVNAEFRAAQKKVVDNTVEYIVSDEKVPMNVAQLVVANGGDVLDWQLFIEIISENDEVPTGFIGDVLVDDEGVETPNTWATWLAPNNTVYEADERKFVATRGHTGKDIALSELELVEADLVVLQGLPVNNIEE